MIFAGGAGDWTKLSGIDYPLPEAMAMVVGKQSGWIHMLIAVGLFGLHRLRRHHAGDAPLAQANRARWARSPRRMTASVIWSNEFMICSREKLR